MKEREAREILDGIFIDSTNEAYPFTEEFGEALCLAIKALEKQEKIKETFTHYPFNGYEHDVLRNCVMLISEIKDILKE